MTGQNREFVPSAEFESGPEARDRHILELTRIHADPRFGKGQGEGVPLAEIKSMVEDVQDGDPEAMASLIGARLPSVYRYVRKSEEIAKRDDLELSDLMQMGAVAIIESALTADVDSPDFRAYLSRETIRSMGRMLTGGKLVPSIGLQKNQVLVGTANGNEERAVDQIVLVEEEDELAGLAIAEEETHGTDVRPDPEDEAVRLTVMKHLFRHLTDEERYVLSRRHGLAGLSALSLEELAGDMGTGMNRTRRIEIRAMKKLKSVEPAGTGAERFYRNWLPES